MTLRALFGSRCSCSGLGAETTMLMQCSSDDAGDEVRRTLFGSVGGTERSAKKVS
jgi:hypothetical protein